MVQPARAPVSPHYVRAQHTIISLRTHQRISSLTLIINLKKLPFLRGAQLFWQAHSIYAGWCTRLVITEIAVLRAHTEATPELVQTVRGAGGYPQGASCNHVIDLLAYTFLTQHAQTKKPDYRISAS